MALVLLEMLEEEAENRRGNLPLRVFRDRSNPLEDLSDESFKYRYRVNKEIANDLCALLHDDLQRSTRRSRSLPVTLQILVTLKYFATGTFQQGNADLHGLHRTTVSRTIHRVAAAMCRHRHEYIKFPQTQMELQQVKEGFYDMSDFPNVLGAVDGSLIPIFAPKKDEHLFVCRKGYHALNIQGICKANMAFTNILAKYPGSTHDAYIWSSSEISFMFETGQIEDGWLLGDSGYPLQPWLLTPLLNPHGRGEEVYNRRHKTARCVIERAFGLLKMRFRCLHDTGGLMMFEPKRCIRVIMACSILHNICISRNLGIDGEEEQLVDERQENQDIERDQDANIMRGGRFLDRGRRIQRNLIQQFQQARR